MREEKTCSNFSRRSSGAAHSDARERARVTGAICIRKPPAAAAIAIFAHRQARSRVLQCASASLSRAARVLISQQSGFYLLKLDQSGGRAESTIVATTRALMIAADLYAERKAEFALLHVEDLQVEASKRVFLVLTSTHEAMPTKNCISKKPCRIAAAKIGRSNAEKKAAFGRVVAVNDRVRIGVQIVLNIIDFKCNGRAIVAPDCTGCNIRRCLRERRARARS